MANTYIDTPFAASGDVTTIPDTVQPDGSISFPQGYGPNYELPQSNPAVLNVERRDMNYLFNLITLNVQQYQQHGIPNFITTADNNGTPFPYSKYAVVLYDPGSGKQAYQSIVNSNVDLPTVAASWAALPLGSYRIRLAANTTFYVATTGNDSNPGTIGSPWLTLQHAVNVISSTIDLGGFNATIQAVDGTYTGGFVLNGAFTGSGQVILQGNVTTPANCIISTTSADCLTAGLNSSVAIGGFKLQTTTGGNCINATDGGRVVFSNKMEFGACAGNHIVAGAGEVLTGSGAYTISGNAVAHLYAYLNGVINAGANAVTVSGTPAFSTAFAFAERGGQISTGQTYSGSATGSHFIVQSCAVINTGGGGGSFFPGSIAGTGTNPGASPYGLYL